MPNDITNDFNKVIAGLPLEMLEELQKFLREKQGAWRSKALDALNIEMMYRRDGLMICNPEIGGSGCG